MAANLAKRPRVFDHDGGGIRIFQQAEERASLSSECANSDDHGVERNDELARSIDVVPGGPRRYGVSIFGHPRMRWCRAQKPLEIVKRYVEDQRSPNRKPGRPKQPRSVPP